jgi:hypothetical protein
MTEPLVPDDHDPAEDAEYVELRFGYRRSAETVDGEHPFEGTSVESHIHHVPDQVVVSSLITLAREILMASMSEHMFRDEVPDEVRKVAAGLMANKWLIQQIESGVFDQRRFENISIPDDARDLFHDD